MFQKLFKLKPCKEWIITDENPLIREKSVPLDVNNITDDDWMEMSKMCSYIEAAYDEKYSELDIKPGIAIAGVQIGYLKRVCYVHFDSNGTTYQYLLVNPKIINSSKQIGYLKDGEGCLSVPVDVPGIVPRSESIIIEYYDPLKECYKTLCASGMLAICLQHEIDHLDGKLYYDKINKTNPWIIDNKWKIVK